MPIKYFVYIVLIATPFFAQSQCTIGCIDDNKPSKTQLVGFVLLLEPMGNLQPQLISNNQGRLWLNMQDYNKLKNKRVVGFQFLNPLHHEKYAPPYALKQRSFLLKELCNKTLMVGYLW